MDHAFLGPSFADQEIGAFLDRSHLRYRKMTDVARATAEVLASDRIVGWFQGRMEFGPRALGARSILASPLRSEMQSRLNEIKDREDFRPVAPVVLEERAHEWFVTRRSTAGKDGLAGQTRAAGLPAPFMLFVFDVRPDKAALIPAVRHVDGARADDRPRAEPALLRRDPRVRRAHRRAGPREHVVQYAERTDRVHPARRGRVLLDLAPRRARDRLLPPREAAALRSAAA
jgi:carbamoyltransferase